MINVIKQYLTFLCVCMFIHTLPAFASHPIKPLDCSRAPTVSPTTCRKNGLIVLPEATRRPWIQAIDSANRSIHLAAYKVSDPFIIDALKSAMERGVKISLIIEPEPFSHEKRNNPILPLIALAHHENISISEGVMGYNQTHYMALLVDTEIGIIGTGNFDEETFDGTQEGTPPCRDFALTINHPEMLKELEHIFTSDQMGVKPTSLKHLVIGPEEMRSNLTNLIHQARHSIRVYQQSLQDNPITEHLVKALERGVEVIFIMPEYPFRSTLNPNFVNQSRLKKAGGQIFFHQSLYLHAKAMIIDAETPDASKVWIGSTNFYPPSLDQTRELGIIIQNPDITQDMLEVFQKDLSLSNPMQ